MKMKKHGMIKKILLFVFVGLIFMILVLYILLGWMWVPRYRTGFNDSNDFAYKIGMSCHDTEYEYCTEIRYVYEKHGWSKKVSLITMEKESVTMRDIFECRWMDNDQNCKLTKVYNLYILKENILLKYKMS